MAYAVRLWQISAALWGYLAWRLLVRMGVLHPRLTPAQELCMIFQRLGTTFVKLGQLLSLRRDLLPDNYVNALQALQDRVVPFAPDQARDEVAQALGKPVEALFVEFDDVPLGAASIAQVHRARLSDGRKVVVKVRRPGIKAAVERDLHLLRVAVRLTARVVPALQVYRPLELLEELAANLRKELDFRQEARSVKRFSEAFADSTTLYIPAVIDDLYTESVLVQELSGGCRVDDPSIRDQGPMLAAAFVDAYLQQFFVLGFFHGDPHPGNLFITPDGRICFHDFGLTGFLDRATRRSLLGFMQAFVHLDSEWLLDAYIDLGIVAGELDRAAFRRGLEELLEDYAARPLKEWSLAEAFVRIVRLGRGQNVLIPHALLVLMRALLLMEHVVRSLDPDFDLLHDLVGRAEEVGREVLFAEIKALEAARLKYETAVLAQALPGALGKWLHEARTRGFEVPLGLRGLPDLEQHLDRSSNRVALALVTLGLYIAASILMQHSLGPRLGGVPLLAVLGYALALWFTFRLARGIRRSGRL